MCNRRVWFSCVLLLLYLLAFSFSAIAAPAEGQNRLPQESQEGGGNPPETSSTGNVSPPQNTSQNTTAPENTTANSQKVALSVSVSSAEMGSVSVSVDGKTENLDLGQISPGSTVVLTATAKKGFDWKEWACNDSSISLSEEQISSPALTFVMPEKNVNLTAVFQKEVFYRLSVEKNDIYGESYIVSGKAEFKKGEEVKVDATPYDGFRFVGWTVTAATFKLTPEQTEDATLSFLMPEENVTLTMNFEPITYYFEVKTKGEGKVEVQDKKPNPAGKYECTVGENIVLFAEAGEEFTFVGWTGMNGAGFSDPLAADTTLTCPASDFTITANFAATFASLTIASSDGGSVSPTEGTLNWGVETIYELIAVPEEGFAFSHWECSSEKGKFENEKDPSTNFTMPNEDCTVTAFFVKGGYTLTVEESVGGTATGLEGTYEMGAQITVSAMPRKGYVFSRWSCSDPDAILDPTKAETLVIMPGKDVTVTAIFVLSTVVGDVTTGPHDAMDSDPFPWLALLVVFFLSAIAICLIVVREKYNLSYLYLIRKWFRKNM